MNDVCLNYNKDDENGVFDNNISISYKNSEKTIDFSSLKKSIDEKKDIVENDKSILK